VPFSIARRPHSQINSAHFAPNKQSFFAKSAKKITIFQFLELLVVSQDGRLDC
jgi:hypothetical protein